MIISTHVQTYTPKPNGDNLNSRYSKKKQKNKLKSYALRKNMKGVATVQIALHQWGFAQLPSTDLAPSNNM